MVLSGYWPATPQIGVTYYSNDLFELWDALCSQSPGTSTTSFLKSLENISISAGRVCSHFKCSCCLIYVILNYSPLCQNFVGM